MGINNYIEFGGVKSSDYGIYVSGEGTFNAPERDVELIEIPGRNGDFSLDKGRFKNITVTYPVYNFESNLDDFRTKLSNFRNALKSKIGYQRLEDTFHPTEYRMATFVDVFDVKPVMYNTASTIELTFNCKPQRFLKSGEEPQTIGEWGETETETGEIVSFEAESNTGIKSLVVDIEPVQSGSGNPSPSNVRPISGWDSVNVYHSGADTTDYTTITKSLGRTVYGGTLDLISGVLTVDRGFYTFVPTGRASTNTSGKYRFYTGRVIPNAISSQSQYLCNYLTPVASTTTGNEGFAITSDDGTGRIIYVYTEATSEMGLTDAKAYFESNPLTFCYPLVTPETYQLTPEQISTVLGTNNIWADSGEVTVEFGADPNILVNPTPFESQPLLEVEGYGEVNLEGQKVNIAQGKPIGNVTIWADTLEPVYTSKDISLDLSKLNTGDKFYLSAVLPIEYYTEDTFSSATDGTATSSSQSFIVNGATLTFSSNVVRFDVLPTDDLEFVKGTTRQYLTTLTVTTTNPTDSITFGLYIKYDSANSEIEIWVSDSEGFLGIDGEVYGYSSLVIQANTFIDCEIGEAYYIEDGEVISANNSVSLPAILPKLKAGSNTITYDNTITELKITPRYWKI